VAGGRRRSGRGRLLHRGGFARIAPAGRCGDARGRDPRRQREAWAGARGRGRRGGGARRLGSACGVGHRVVDRRGRVRRCRSLRRVGRGLGARAGAEAVRAGGAHRRVGAGGPGGREPAGRDAVRNADPACAGVGAGRRAGRSGGGPAGPHGSGLHVSRTRGRVVAPTRLRHPRGVRRRGRRVAGRRGAGGAGDGSMGGARTRALGGGRGGVVGRVAATAARVAGAGRPLLRDAGAPGAPLAALVGAAETGRPRRGAG
jgi:hypothetical protein